MRDIPHFAFSPENIDIRENTSAWHNDYMRLRISQLPVAGLKMGRDVFINLVDTGSEEGIDVMVLSVRVEHGDKSLLLRRVTTDDCSFSINGKALKSPYPSPILLCNLRYGEVFEMVARTDVGVPSTNPRYGSASVWFAEKEKGDYHLFIEPRPGVTGREIMWRAREVIVRRLRRLVQQTKDQQIVVPKSGKVTSGEIRIEEDKFTLPELLCALLKDLPAVLYVGYKCEHMLSNTSVVYYQVNGSIVRLLEEVQKKFETKTAALVSPGK